MAHSAYAQYGIGFIENRMKINLPKRRDLLSAIKVKAVTSNASASPAISFTLLLPLPLSRIAA